MRSFKNKIGSVERFDSIIERVLQALLKDLIIGIKQEEAGWRPLTNFGIDPADQNELLKRDIIVKNTKGKVRFNLRNNRIRQKLKLFDLQFKQLDYFLKTQEVVKSDVQKVEKAHDILRQIDGILKGSPEAWVYIIALGWWKMLESSGMPTLIDDALEEGFSPKDWTVQATLSSSQLALSIAKKFGQIHSLKEALDFLKERGICKTDGISLPLAPNEATIQKIKKVLKWRNIETKLTEPCIKMLSFLWFSLFILESNNLLPLSAEVPPKLLDVIWKTLVGLLEKDQSSLLSELEEITNMLIDERITWASDILRVPEIV